MKYAPQQYQKVALSYLQASEKIWSREVGAPYQPDHLLAPALHCLAQAYELALKALVLSRGGSHGTLHSYGHDFWEIWQSDTAQSLRDLSRRESISWHYPWKLQPNETTFGKFEEMLDWLSAQHSGNGGEGKRDHSLRYPSSLKKEVFPPDFLQTAANSILGVIHDEIEN